MSSSRVILFVAFFVLVGGRAAVSAQDRAIALYNDATRLEVAGFDHEEGGPGSAVLRMAQRDCTVPARQSFTFDRSRLAAWRLLSCAAGIESWIMAHLAVEAFRALQLPQSIEEWTHARIDEEERARVREAIDVLPFRVGAVRIDVEGARLIWAAGRAPLAVPEGGVPRFDVDPEAGVLLDGPVRVGDLLYLPAGGTLSVTVSANGALSAVSVIVRPLGMGGPMSLLEALLPIELPEAGARAAFAEANDALEACVVEPVGVRVVVGPDGAVRAVSLTGRVASDAAVTRCVSRALASVTTPAFRGPEPATIELRVSPPRLAAAAEMRRDDRPTGRDGGGRQPARAVDRPSGGPDLLAPGLILGTGLAAAAAGVVLLALGDGIRADLDRACPLRMGCDPSLRDDAERGATLNLAGNATLIGGGAVAGIGVVWLIVTAVTWRRQRRDVALGVGWSPAGADAWIGGAW
jgi:hypothetical protein